MLNRRTADIVHMLEEEGVKSCVLKGQGNAVMYPNPYLRISGDIDVWVDGGRKEVLSLVRKQSSRTHLRYHHVDFPIFKDAAVELHFMPSSMNNPVYNGMLRRWFEKRKEQQFAHSVTLPCGDSVPAPTVEFNVVYQWTFRGVPRLSQLSTAWSG